MSRPPSARSADSAFSNDSGAGGMGVVYEAYDPDVARDVALKLVNVASKDRETALAEAKALARLSHPNVVPIYDVGLAGKDPTQVDSLELRG